MCVRVRPLKCKFTLCQNWSVTGFDDLAVQQARSRIYGGIHFQFDSDASRAACPKVSEWAFAHYMLPLEHK